MSKRSSLSVLAREWLFFIVLLAVALPGCKKKDPPPPQATPLPKKTEQAISAVVPVKPVQSANSSVRNALGKSPVLGQMSTSKRPLQPGAINLDFTNRRDPFKPFVQAPTPQQAVVGKSGKSRAKESLPIQSFDTEKFKVSGIITGIKANSALVIDPKGKGYVVKEGMPIGTNDGYVKRVTDSAVEVEEVFKDDNGRTKKRLVKLMLLRKK